MWPYTQLYLLRIGNLLKKTKKWLTFLTTKNCLTFLTTKKWLSFLTTKNWLTFLTTKKWLTFLTTKKWLTFLTKSDIFHSLSVFYHFVGLALKAIWLKKLNKQEIITVLLQILQTCLKLLFVLTMNSSLLRLNAHCFDSLSL